MENFIKACSYFKPLFSFPENIPSDLNLFFIRFCFCLLPILQTFIFIISIPCLVEIQISQIFIVFINFRMSSGPTKDEILDVLPKELTENVVTQKDREKYSHILRKYR